jgi:hypothetical protein
MSLPETTRAGADGVSVAGNRAAAAAGHLSRSPAHFEESVPAKKTTSRTIVEILVSTG